MRVLTRAGAVDDHWVRLGDEVPLLPGTDCLVSYARWCAEVEACARHDARIAIVLATDDDLAEIAAHLARFDLIAIEFPKFADGRGFSQARLLRERYGYRGELRAVGEILRDQLDFLARCGFDSFEWRGPRDPQEALRAFAEFTVRYQSAADGAPPIWQTRQAMAKPEDPARH